MSATGGVPAAQGQGPIFKVTDLSASGKTSEPMSLDDVKGKLEGRNYMAIKKTSETTGQVEIEFRVGTAWEVIKAYFTSTKKGEQFFYRSSLINSLMQSGSNKASALRPKMDYLGGMQARGRVTGAAGPTKEAKAIQELQGKLSNSTPEEIQALYAEEAKKFNELFDTNSSLRDVRSQIPTSQRELNTARSEKESDEKLRELQKKVTDLIAKEKELKEKLDKLTGQYKPKID